MNTAPDTWNRRRLCSRSTKSTQRKSEQTSKD
nr:MAG TPA: hypothetical protein [Caudoviricetes sp.]